jgi:hypothetical protein
MHPNSLVPDVKSACVFNSYDRHLAEMLGSLIDWKVLLQIRPLVERQNVKFFFRFLLYLTCREPNLASYRYRCDVPQSFVSLCVRLCKSTYEVLACALMSVEEQIAQ